MFNNLQLTKQSLKDQFIKKLRQKLYDKKDFTQGEYIEAIDEVREVFQNFPEIDYTELDEIVKSLTYDWKEMGEVVRTGNISYRANRTIIIITLVTALITGLVTWLLLRNNKK